MSHLRALVRLKMLIVISLFFLGLRLLAWPTALVSRRWDRGARRLLLRLWAYCFAWAAGMRVNVIGPAPKPPFYLVMNHLSYLDMLILARQTGCIFVSRGDVADWPLFGAIAKSLYILFINRTDKRDTARVNALIEQCIQEGDGIAVFPESRVTCGIDVDPFKSALLQPPIAMGMPVHYASLYYRTPEGAPTEGALVSWWRPEPFYTHLYRFLRSPGAEATIHFGEAPLTGTDRKELTSRLYAAVRANFKPLRQAAASCADEEFPVETPTTTKETALEDA